MHTLFPNRVQLEPISHTYKNSAGEEYLSVTKFLNMLSERFEDTPAYKIASAETREEWKQKGQVARDHGTNIHNALEDYSKTGQVEANNLHLQPVIQDILNHYAGYRTCHDEICLYNDEYKMAGTADKLCVISNRKNCEVDIADFKTNISKGVVYHSDYKKRMYAPLNHLQDCNYVKYSLQLSIYAYFFEQLTGRRVRKLFLHFIPPNDMMKHQIIPITYLKNDVKTVLELYKSKVEAIVRPNEVQIINDDYEF